MSIQSEINRITDARDDSFDAVAAKGVTVPTGSTIDDLPALIGQIQTGGGGSVTVNPLSVTQNGTYTAPTGTAYSPVTVNVSGGGSSSAQRKDVNFFDYDGTIQYSYTAAEALALTELPANPSHTGLVAQGWNWTLAQMKAQVTAMGKCDIGQMYITASGDTEIDVSFPDSARLSPIMTIAVNGTITVDWGDGTTADTVTGTSLTTQEAVPHTYATTGDYMIVVHVVSGSFSFYCTSNYTILRKNTTTNQNRVYTNAIQKIRLGNGITSIASNAFYTCCSLASITIPSGVTSIETNAFSTCYSLTSITIPSGVTSIASNAFYSCHSLASIIIPSGVTSIASNAFYTCYSLTSITIPSGVTSIGTRVFSTCCSLASITIPSGVTSIENQTFYNCYGLGAIHFKSSTPPTVANSNAFTGVPNDCIIYVPAGTLSDYTSASNYPSSSTYTYVEE